MSTHPSEMALERHLLDPGRSKIAAHLEACARCAGRIDEMRREGEQFFQFVFPATVEKIEEAADRGARRFSWIAWLAPATAAAAAAALLLVAQPTTQDDLLRQAIREGFVVQEKGGRGGIGLGVFLNGTGGAHAAREGEVVAAAAAVRFRVQPTVPCHLWVVSIDSSGQVSRLFPTEGDGGALIATRFEVPGGAVLDGKPGPERVFAICTPGSMYYATVERILQTAMARGESAVRSLRDVPGFPDGTGMASVLLEKQ